MKSLLFPHINVISDRVQKPYSGIQTYIAPLHSFARPKSDADSTTAVVCVYDTSTAVGTNMVSPKNPSHTSSFQMTGPGFSCEKIQKRV